MSKPRGGAAAAALLLLVALIVLVETQQASGWLMQKSSHYEQKFSENENDDQNEDFTQLAESLAISAAAESQNAAANSQCEPINFSLCSPMHYNFTRMSNFFGDPNQIEAAERAKQYEPLVRSQCSRHLLAYLCELLAPMCIINDSQKKFQIYPCRPFCRQVKHDCWDQIRIMADRYKLGRVPAAFDCDSLPYEINGGNGELGGPCHEMPADGPPPPAAGKQAEQSGANANIANNNYKPYQKELDMTPFIMDNSPIDKRIIRPSKPAPPVDGTKPATTTATPEHNSSVASQLQSLGHQLAVGLMYYSNLLSVLTLICLLLVVNAKRLKRFRSYLARRSSSSSNRSSGSSSAASDNSRRRLAAGQALGQAARKLGLSPSSSSRSLVLVATDGKRGQPKHKLLHAGELVTGSLEPSQKLLQAGLDRRTLINVNGTLERQKQQQNSAAARYQLMQSLGAANEAADHNKQHQYDYIQVLTNPARASRQAGAESFEQRQAAAYLGQQQAAAFRSANSSRPPTQEAQLYSNILLSSPSHQVLLFGDANSAAADSQPLAGRQHFMTNASSPYADPTIGAGSSPGSGRPGARLMTAATDAAGIQQLMAERQRSFQRRPSGSGSSSSRFRRASNTGTAASAGAYVSSAGSSASSSAGSTTSSFSPPESFSGNPLLANQFVQSARPGRGPA
jgi:hypothetical protein